MDPDDLVDDEPQLDDELLDEGQEDEDQVDDLLDDPEDQDDESDPEPAHQQRRKPASERIRELSSREKAEKERADRAEAELNRFRAGPVKTPQELARERDAHLATLTEGQRLEYLINEGQQQTKAELNQIRFASFDASDQGRFEAMCARNPAVAAVKDEVETTLRDMRANGSNATRETVAAYVIGQRALSKQPRAKTAGAKRAAENRDRQSGRPVSGRSDLPPSRQRGTNEAEARRKRLDGMKL